MTPAERRQRNRDIVLWLCVGLIGVAVAPRPDVWAISYAIGSACVLLAFRRGWL